MRARTYSPGWDRQVIYPATPLRARPDAARGLDGRRLSTASASGSMQRDRVARAWVQLASDGYVGYVRASRRCRRKSTPPRTACGRLGRSFMPPPTSRQPH